jgi:hypothetical protein
MSNQSHSPDRPLLLEQCFTSDAQAAFCRLSGDYNPIHADPVAARRMMAGGQVVHGIHQALAALEAALSQQRAGGQSIRHVTSLKAVFKIPVRVGDTVGFYLSACGNEGCEIECRAHGKPVSNISIGWKAGAPVAQRVPPPLAAESAVELGFAEMEGMAGSLSLGLDESLAGAMFPAATSALGPLGIAGVLGLSRLVGMHCPGLHSLFGDLAVTLGSAESGDRLHYRVCGTDERFAKVQMEVNGPGIAGRLTAFLRPRPERQPGIEEVSTVVTPGSFSQSIALIAGGSRGLGEITAKIIAAGGGLPIITYYQGADDAQRIGAEIRSAGARCEVLRLDVRSAAVEALPADPRSLYYFATPKIFGRRRNFFDYELLRDFEEVYVVSFGRLIDRLIAGSAGKLKVFYPSSVAVDEPLRGLWEYAMAKRSGEELCDFYNRYSGQVEILIDRLPRIKTDQTSTLMEVPAEDALQVMLPLVSRMETSIQESGAVPV